MKKHGNNQTPNYALPSLFYSYGRLGARCSSPMATVQSRAQQLLLEVRAAAVQQKRGRALSRRRPSRLARGQEDGSRRRGWVPRQRRRGSRCTVEPGVGAGTNTVMCRSSSSSASAHPACVHSIHSREKSHRSAELISSLGLPTAAEDTSSGRTAVPPRQHHHGCSHAANVRGEL